MRTLYLKAVAWLALPVSVLVLAVLTGFQNPGRFSGAVGRQEFNDSLATRRDSIRSITGRIDTLIGPNGDVYIKDAARILNSLTVDDTVMATVLASLDDSLEIFSSSAYQYLITRSNMVFAIDYNNNQTNAVALFTKNGTSTIMLALKEVASGDSFHSYAEYAKMDGSLTVTDTTTATGGLKVGAGTLITGIVDKTDSLLIILNVTDSCYVKITTRL